jgi:Icc-related predicted phosphoesterase
MKVLAFVDMHGSMDNFDAMKKKVEKAKPEIIVCAGDFTIFENDIKKIMHKFSKLGKKVFLVHGNHEEGIVVKGLAKEYENIEFIHKRIAHHKGVVLLGWGGGGFTIKETEFEKWIRKEKKVLKQYKHEGKKLIFVAHAPFYKTHIDFLDGVHRGNKSFRNFLKRYDVDLGFCGHFHENEGKEDKVGHTKIYNPGPKGKLIEI